MRRIQAGVVALLLAAPAVAQVEAPPIITTETVCRDGYVYRERCAEIDGEKVCTLDPVNNLAVGAQVKGCSDMTVLGTFAIFTAVHGSDLWATSYGIDVRGNTVELNPLGKTVEQRVALKLSVIASSTLAVHVVARKNPKLAKRMRTAIAAVLGGVAIQNMYQTLSNREAKTVPLPPVAVAVSW